jgi:GT2 family glycosyltransferase
LAMLKISIPSIMRTKYPDFEIIVVDNGSSDGSVSFLSQHYPDVTVLPLETNVGVAAGYNLGVSLARGPLVSFLNNDIEVDPNWLLPLVLVLGSDKLAAGCDSKYLNFYEREKIDISGGAGRFVDKYGNSVNRGAGKKDRGQFSFQEVFHGLSIFNKDLITRVGGFDESFFAYYDETDLCWRLHRLGYRILFVPDSVIYHMLSATTSVSGSKMKLKKLFVFHLYKNRLRMLIKNQFGISLLFSVIVYLFDMAGVGLDFLLTGDQDYIPILGKALFWNLRNLSGTFRNRIRFMHECSDFRKLLVPYSGIWKTHILTLFSKV